MAHPCHWDSGSPRSRARVFRVGRRHRQVLQLFAKIPHPGDGTSLRGTVPYGCSLVRGPGRNGKSLQDSWQPLWGLYHKHWAGGGVRFELLRDASDRRCASQVRVLSFVDNWISWLWTLPLPSVNWTCCCSLLSLLTWRSIEPKRSVGPLVSSSHRLFQSPWYPSEASHQGPWLPCGLLPSANQPSRLLAWMTLKASRASYHSEVRALRTVAAPKLWPMTNHRGESDRFAWPCWGFCGPWVGCPCPYSFGC